MRDHAIAFAGKPVIRAVPSSEPKRTAPTARGLVNPSAAAYACVADAGRRRDGGSGFLRTGDVMVLPTRTPPDPAVLVRNIDPGWAERLESEAARYERIERGSGWRRAGACLLAAAAVVVLGLAGFRYETDTRLGPAHPRTPGWVTVTLDR